MARLGAGMKGRRRWGALCRSAQESEGGLDRLPGSVLWPGQECGSAFLSISLSSPRATRFHALEDKGQVSACSLLCARRILVR